MTPSPSSDPTRDLPYAYGGPVLRGRLRAVPEDFVVDEDLGYRASGDGEHVLLTVLKRGRNTHEVARALARLAGVPQVAVGYAGLKDRNAVATQHFSVQLTRRDAPDWGQLDDAGLQVLTAQRHRRKIRRGSLRGNVFRIRVTGVRGDRHQAEALLSRIAGGGVPNYFGSQRFGRDGGNLARADELFAGRGRRPGREQRGLLLSAVRAQLFNQVLSARVETGRWGRAVRGDVLLLAGSQRQFSFDAGDDTLADRLARLDVHPSGPLCGRSGHALQAADDARAIEVQALSGRAAWIEGLARFGLAADRRALRLDVRDLRWYWDGDNLQLAFALTAGAYATAVLRELVLDEPVGTST